MSTTKVLAFAVMMVALSAILAQQSDQIKALEARVAALEARQK